MAGSRANSLQLSILLLLLALQSLVGILGTGNDWSACRRLVLLDSHRAGGGRAGLGKFGQLLGLEH